MCIHTYTEFFLFPFICQGTFRLLPCLDYYKHSCKVCWGVCILSYHVCLNRPCILSWMDPVHSRVIWKLYFQFSKGTSILFFTVATPIYSPTNSAGGFPSGLRHFLKKGSNMSNIPHIVHMIGRSEKVKTSPECPIRFLNSYQSYMWNTDHSDPNLTSSYKWTQTIFVRF